MPTPNKHKIIALSKQVSNRDLSIKEREAALQKLTMLVNKTYKDSEERLNTSLNNFDRQWHEFTVRNAQFFDDLSLSSSEEREVEELLAKVQDQVRLEELEKLPREKGTPIPPVKINNDDDTQVKELISQVMDEIRLEELSKQSRRAVTPTSEDDEIAQLEAELEEDFDNTLQETPDLEDLIKQSHELIKESESIGLFDEDELEREIAALSDKELEDEVGEEYEKLRQEIAKEEGISTPLINEDSKKNRVSETVSKVKGEDRALSHSHQSTEKKGFLGFIQTVIQSIRKGFVALFGGEKPESSPVISVEKMSAPSPVTPKKIKTEPIKSETISTQKNDNTIKGYRNPKSSNLEQVQEKHQRFMEAHQKAQKSIQNIIEIKQQYKEKMRALREERDEHLREYKDKSHGPRR